MVTYRVILNHVDLLEAALKESTDMTNTVIDSVEGKPLAELENLYEQLRSSSVIQPHNEKLISV